MQIYADKLESHLKQSLAGIYLIAGDDDLLRDEAVQQVRDAALKQAFSNHQKFIQDGSFNWMQLLDACSALSLFAERQLLELTLHSSKIGNEGSQALLQCLNALDSETLLLINAPRIEGKPKWVKAITESGVYVPIYPLDNDKLPGWLIHRARLRGLTLLKPAAEQLAERVEGNLVSAVQELEKLALLAGDNATIDEALIESSVADNARFSTFNMLDRAIDGDARSACKALQKIREEGAEAVAVIGAVAYQLRTLLSLVKAASTGELNQAIKTKRVLPKRQAAISKAVQRLSAPQLSQCIQILNYADLSYKSGQRQISWMAIEAIILCLAGKPLNSNLTSEAFNTRMLA